ncbi:MAG: hypothetical protein RJB37_3742, partial [Pseudomonadota bacterium]
IARELHDEFGQRLTALRFDAAWLARQVADQPELLGVVQGMSARCAEVQQDIRQMLVDLRPFGPVGSEAATGTLPLDRLCAMLEALVQGWRDTRSATTFSLTLDLPPGREAIELPLDLALTVYRISQEALTNAARHAQARHITLQLRLEPAPDGPDRGWLHWSVRDDGVGLAGAAAALQRGNGLGGMQERVWAQGGEWQVLDGENVRLDTEWPGLLLRARLPLNPPPATPLSDPAP